MADKNKIFNGAAPVFGDEGQITKLRKHRHYEQEMIDQHVYVGHDRVDVSANVTVNFPCAECLTEVSIFIQLTDIKDMDLEGMLNVEKHECTKCGCVYQMEQDRIIMIKNPKYPWKLDESIENPDDHA